MLRLQHIAASLAGLALSVTLFAGGSSILLLPLLPLYILSCFSSRSLAKSLNRAAAGWVALGILLPFVGPLMLGLLGPRHQDSMRYADGAWARMDTPGNQMVINAVLMFDEPLDFAALQELIRERLLKYEQFRKRVVGREGFPRWADDPRFDLANHLVDTTLPGDGSERELQRYVSQQMSRELHPDRPLWQIQFVSNFSEGTALIARIHHCIGDGIALIRLLLSLTDAEPSTVQIEKSEALANPKAAPADKSEGFRNSNKIVRSLGSAMGTTRVGTLLRQLGKLLLGISRLLLMGPDSRSSLKGRALGKKLARWSPPIPLPEIKAASHALGGKINDLLMTAMAGALRRYLEQHQSFKRRATIRMVVPIDLRPETDQQSLGNHFSTIFVPLPVGLDEPRDRFREMQRQMNRIKRSFEPIAAYGILNIIGMVPRWLESLILKIFAIKGSGVMSNVPGPRQTIYLTDSPLKRIMFWVPQICNHALGVSILSYAGEVMIGITTDEAVISDPEAIVSAFMQETQSLIALSGVSSAKSAQVPDARPTSHAAARL